MFPASPNGKGPGGLPKGWSRKMKRLSHWIGGHLPLLLAGWYFYGMLINPVRLGIDSTFRAPGSPEIKSIWVLGLMISNGLVALSGALLTQYQGFADINMGRGAIVIGLAAVIIGEAIFGKVFVNFGFRLLGVAFGSIIYYLVLQFVIAMGLDTDLLKLLSALVVAVFLGISTMRQRILNFWSWCRMKFGGKGGRADA